MATAVLIWFVPFFGAEVIMTLFADIVFWPMDDAQSFTGQEVNLLSVISAGLMGGIGWAIYRLADEGLDIAPDFSCKTIKQVIWIWFIVDCLGSILIGAHLNVIGNSVFLAAVLLPMRAAKP